eukprot:6564562-Prymnesium_polylepis.2
MNHDCWDGNWRLATGRPPTLVRGASRRDVGRGARAQWVDPCEALMWGSGTDFVRDSIVIDTIIET